MSHIGGATAIVYEASDYGEEWSASNCPTKIALKVFLTKNGRCTTPMHALQREICCADSLQHPNIARLLEVVAHGEDIALAWELVQGPDMLEYVQRCERRMPEPLAAHYFRQLVDAVAYMHAQGISHRDLKPENCMVDLRMHALKVIDFGLAARVDVPMSLGVGTVDYLAPELIKGCRRSPSPDPVSVDTWGLGVVLYIMLAGRLPFQDPKHPHCLRHTLTNIKHGRMRPLPDHISPAAVQLVRALLRTTATLRPSLSSITAHPWLDAAAGPLGVPSAALREAFALEGEIFSSHVPQNEPWNSYSEASSASVSTCADDGLQQGWAQVSMTASEASSTQQSSGHSNRVDSYKRSSTGDSYAADSPRKCSSMECSYDDSISSNTKQASVAVSLAGTNSREKGSNQGGLGVSWPHVSHSSSSGGSEHGGWLWGDASVPKAKEDRAVGESTWEETVLAELGNLGSSLKQSLDTGHSSFCAGAEMVRQGAKSYMQRLLSKAGEAPAVVHLSADARTDQGQELSGVVVHTFALEEEVQRGHASLGSAATPADSAALPPLPPLPSPLLATTSDVSSQIQQAGRQARLSFSNGEESKRPPAIKSALLRNWSGSGDMWDSARELHTLPGQRGQLVGVASPQTQSRPCFLHKLADVARQCA